MTVTGEDWFQQSFPKLLRGESLSADQVRAAIEAMITGQFDECQSAAFLIALRMRGETADDIATAARVLREHMVPLDVGDKPVLDTCGTGGDESGTFNISTAVALVTAAAGVPVVKHGNRSVSSRSGSADVLRALNVPIEAGPAWACATLATLNFAFCFAPHFHPAMAHVAPLRKKLGVRTLFNLLGPLVNPARAPYQILGVGRPELLEPLSGAIAQLETRRAVLIWSHNGLDEISLGAPTRAVIVEQDSIREEEWVPADFGLSPCELSDLRVDGPEESAGLIRSIFAGQDSPARRVVLANAAAALWTAEYVSSMPEGVERAEWVIDSGKVQALLADLVISAHQSKGTEPHP